MEDLKEKGSSAVSGRAIDKPFVSTRPLEGPEIEYNPNEPRIGRRDSEPHSYEVSTLKEILSLHFPDSRTLWDLHHYFKLKDKFLKEIDIKFDISFFLGWKMDKYLSSFDSEQFENRIPILAVNILSRRTWHDDIGENVDHCKAIGIKYYIVYAAYHVASKYYKPPFLRIYRLKDGIYTPEDVRELAIKDDGSINLSGIVDIGPEIPFRIGLAEKKEVIFEEENMYHLVIFHKTKNERLLSAAEQERQRAEQERQRAEQERQRAEQERQRAEQERQRAEQERQRAEQEKMQRIEADKKWRIYLQLISKTGELSESEKETLQKLKKELEL